MAEFLNTTATSYRLEKLIKTAKEKLILISPFLKINDRIKELLEDKDRLKLDVRIIYGKNELQNDEINWLNELISIRTSFCKNLHAKCYINEESCIITSMNLYEFSQVNNNEMGIYISKTEDDILYKDAYEESQRIIRSSDEVRISLEKITDKSLNNNSDKLDIKKENHSKLTTYKLAIKVDKTTKELTKDLISNGYLIVKDGKEELTKKGKESGGESKNGKFGNYFLWNEDIQI